jgi:anti-sigma regulatory factor (Ser/Thr protein kinase)
VERGETDPALLERLYSIDHIAVRLRRNADSLMLLAGIRETVLDGGPTELTNVVRAALGQIEGFQRVGLRADTDVMVEPDIIGDLTLMVAELLENAVAFSPAGSPVEVVVRADGDGALILVADHGLGMSAERLAEENARLIRRERLDLVPTKVLGLFVVGTLARRWEIEVTLSRTPGGGVTAEVIIPASLLLRMSAMASGGSAVGSGAAAIEAPVGSGSGAVKGLAGSGTGPTAAAAVSGAERVVEAGGTAAVQAGVASGPRPSAAAAAEPYAAPAEHARAGDLPAPLPRRVPRHETAPADVTAAPSTPYSTPYTAESQPDDFSGSARPLRRRVRGATLRTVDPAAEAAARQPARPADADAVRSALEEFEAAVERAHRDSDSVKEPGGGGPTGPRTNSHSHDQNHLPEGAEQ